MPITLISGPANAGKAELAMDAVRRHLAHGEEPLLIVPTREDAEHYLRELAGYGAAMGVRVERFAGLIGEAVRRTGIAEPVLGEHARERVLEAVVARAHARVGQPEERPDTPGFAGALGEVISELQARRVTPARLRQAVSSWRAADGAGAHPARLEQMFADYCATLRRLGRLDAEQRAVRALDALRERPALWGRTPVVFYGFDDLTRLQLDTIETLGRVLDADVTVSLAYEPGRAAFAGRAASYHALVPLASAQHRLPARAEHYAPGARVALSHLERSLFEPRAPRIEASAAVRLLEGGGERAELELLATEIVSLLGGGMAPGEIAVLVRPGGTDLDLLEEVFAASAIPFALRRSRPFGDTAIGRALIGLLRCVPAPDGSGMGELADLLAWLRAPGLLAISATRDAGAEHPDGHARAGAASLADRLEIAARRAGAASAAQARALWEQRYWRLEPIDRFAQAQERGAAALCQQAARELHWLFCAPRRAGASLLDADELGEASALAAGRRALAELRELARSAAELAPATASELARVLEPLELRDGERGAAERADAVAVLDPLALRARRVRVLFACGLQEGAFPARAQPQPFLAEDERRRLAEVSGLRLGEREDVLAAERYLLYAAVSRPEEQLLLSWHVADDEGVARSRSLFVDDVCDLFADSLYGARRVRPLGAIDGAPAQIADAREAGPGERPPPDAREAGAGERPLPDAREAGPEERPLRDERLLEQLRTHIWSASSLERWIGCPVSWFVERMLRPDAFEPDPEPLARGGLAHAALKDTLEGLRLRTGSARLTRASIALARELLAQALTDNEARRPLSGAPERRIAVRRRLQSDLERYLEHAAEPASRLEPLALELGFGFAEGDGAPYPDGAPGEASELPALELGGGVRLRGRIDRVDVSANGEAVVYDYKGGRAPAGARWLRDASIQVALYMRAVEELLRCPAVGGFYQPLTGEDLRARGVLDGDAGIELDCMRPDVLEHDELRELLAQAVAMAIEAAGEAGRGELSPRPQTCAFRGGCMYPTICRCER
jgi:PD-(D/E)XK nuclease superfamily protein/AddB-like protein